MGQFWNIEWNMDIYEWNNVIKQDKIAYNFIIIHCFFKFYNYYYFLFQINFAFNNILYYYYYILY